MPVFQAGYHTESLGTEISEAIPPLAGHIPRLTHLRYTPAGSVHKIYVMKCIGTTLADKEAASGQANIDFVDTSPHITPAGAQETIAANDWVCYMTEAGIEGNDVASIAGNVVTFNQNLGAVVPKGGGIYVFGELTRAVHTALWPTVSVTNDYADLTIQAGIPADTDVYQARSGSGDPMLIVVDNPTAAGALEYLSGVYVPDSDLTQN
jgi:hypothetical protein